MNIYSLDYYREIVRSALAGTGAFIRVSRSEGLFVTDAKRRSADMAALYEKLPGFSFCEKDGLTYLTPDYGFSDDTNILYTEILKAGNEESEKLIRMNLSKAMRLKNDEQIKFFKILYERMITQ